ncbi:MAG: exodeoxyribonuclease III [Alphaproteobacteria bacterium]|nr:exodeoxyribonuclease III [Alphaproteobacteria bacterium]
MLKLATWNVNSIRIRLGLLERLEKEEALDVLCLQEVKAKEEDFPFDEIKRLGFDNIALYGMAGYNGVAILSKLPLENAQRHDHVGKSDARHISACINDVEIHNIYIPAGGDVPDINENPSFLHKLNFVDEMADFFADESNRKILICGDFNIAPSKNDVWSHKALLQTVSHTPIEVEKLQNFFAKGKFVDAVRHIYNEPQKIYSWWSYRNPNWQTNDKGRRLDHIWVSKNMTDAVDDIKIRKDFRAMERPSDHAPVIITLKL